jgi:siroheme synthase
MTSQRVTHTRLFEMAAVCALNHVAAPATIVVGDVVNVLRDPPQVVELALVRAREMGTSTSYLSSVLSSSSPTANAKIVSRKV